MLPLSEMKPHQVRYLFTDIDDTLTTDGQLTAAAYSALWDLKNNGFEVVPVTGRPAGWCEMIARFWPVAGVVGENGGFYFRHSNQHMKRFFAQDKATREQNQKRLRSLSQLILSEVPEADLASDQFTRLIDLAIDYCEDIPRLSPEQIKKILDLFHSAGAQAKLSSIHINGWFGDHDKSSMCFRFLKNEFHVTQSEAQELCAFVGDSPNDEPLFRDFKMSFAVANLKNFLDKLEFLPAYISEGRGGQGFVEISKALIAKK